MLIIEQKFALGEYEPNSGRFALQRLTVDGHDFIDMTRQKSVWEHAKAAMKEGGGATLGRFRLSVSCQDSLPAQQMREDHACGL
jgi:hypothetical protein